MDPHTEFSSRSCSTLTLDDEAEQKQQATRQHWFVSSAFWCVLAAQATDRSARSRRGRGPETGQAVFMTNCEPSPVLKPSRRPTKVKTPWIQTQSRLSSLCCQPAAWYCTCGPNKAPRSIRGGGLCIGPDASRRDPVKRHRVGPGAAGRSSEWEFTGNPDLRGKPARTG